MKTMGFVTHRNCHNNRAACSTIRSRRRIFALIIYAVIAATTSRRVLAFTCIRTLTKSQTRHSSSARCRASTSCLQLSSKEEAAPLNFNLTISPESFVPTNADGFPGDTTTPSLLSPTGVVVPGAMTMMCCLLLSSTTAVSPSAMLAIYSSLLVEHPLPTKSFTGGALCGIGDAIAQFRDSSRGKFNYVRLIRFAGKGCVGGIIWSFWYDNLDKFLDLESDFNIYQLSGTHGLSKSTASWIRDHTAIVTTSLSILIEQFFWCPIVFGTFEIPVSTLLNGGSLTSVQKEVNSKLNGLLLSNAKVWTLANVLIYNAPVQWRPAVSNCFDLIWQSIVSDVAADCGKVEDDIS